MTSLQIRAATDDDAEPIARLVNEAFRSERFFTDYDRTNPENVQELLQKGRFLLLYDDSELAACVYVEQRGDRGYFGMLAVDPKRQNSGLGSRLIAAAEQDCRESGCRFMDLTLVNLRTELPAYYRRFGYVENGTLPFPIDQNQPKMPAHLIQMSKAL
jgi:N-acetylglutamate synthase-like GNAT family acetyltransferase